MTTRAKPLRRDAARNRDKLLVAASRVFTTNGLDASLEDIARHADVSIGTLYNHFGTREALFDAVMPERVAALDRLAESGLSHDDAWEGFWLYLDGLFATLATDRGLRHVMTREYPNARLLTEACHRGFANAEAIIARARQSGQLRSDFTSQDLACLMWSVTRLIDATADVAPDAWRRFLGITLDGLRSGAARPLDTPAMSPRQVAEVLTTSRT